MEIKLVIFDFDGTIADTKKLIVASKQEVMKKMGFKIENEEVCASTIGLTAKRSFEVMYPQLSEEDIDRCVEIYRNAFSELQDKIPPVLFPNVEEVLEEIKKRGIMRSIATSRNRESLMGFLNKWDIAGYFPYVLGGDDTTVNKPEPEPLLKTLRELSVKAEEALVVGDMSYDIEMGRRAGAYTCGVTYGNGERSTLKDADFIIDGIAELIDILQGSGG